jgi:hypothetical protein
LHHKPGRKGRGGEQDEPPLPDLENNSRYHPVP